LTVKINDKVAGIPGQFLCLIRRNARTNKATRAKFSQATADNDARRSSKDLSKIGLELFRTVSLWSVSERRKRMPREGSYDVEFLAEWDLHE